MHMRQEHSEEIVIKMKSALLLMASFLSHGSGHVEDNQDIESPSTDLNNEYCQYETFQPKCSKNDVIVIGGAIYGRMRIGKCITAKEISSPLFEKLREDPSFLGCSADLMDAVDQKCSLKSKCEIRISDLDREQATPCSPGLKLNLEVNYTCINVVENDRSCRLFATYKEKYMIPSQDLSGACGSSTQPWIMEAPKGQRIKVSRVEVGFKKSQMGSGSNRCSASASQGVIMDRLARKNVTICEDGGLAATNDERGLYLSTGNLLEVILHHSRNPTRKLVLKIEASGCSDIIPPEDAWLKRNVDDVVIGCYSSKQTWQLHCENRKWIGVVGNCSTEISVDGHHPSNSETSEAVEIPKEQQVLIIVSICGFGVVICIAIICTGVICLKRCYSLDRKVDESQARMSYNSVRSTTLRCSAHDATIRGDNFQLDSYRSGGINARNGQSTNYSVTAGRDVIDNRNCNFGDVMQCVDDAEDSKYFVLDRDTLA